MASGHRPRFPQISAATERTLAVFDGRYIIDEDGVCYDVYDVDDFCNVVFDNNLLMLTDSIPSFPYTYDAVHRGHQVYCTDKGRPSMVRLKYKTQTRYVVKSTLWNKDLPADSILMKGMRKSFKHIGLGVKPTPSSMGKETMRVSWIKHFGKKTYHTAPSVACEKFIKDNCSGPVVMTPGLHTYFDTAILLDRKSAFPTEMVQLPDGTSIACSSAEALNDFPIWFGLCHIVVDYNLPIGPFPIRTNADTMMELVQYYTHPGEYDAYLWNFQISDCEKVGCRVYPQYGFAWEKTTDNASHWTQDMYSLRQRAEDAEVASYIKIITNAAIGGLGGSRVGYKLVTESEATEDDTPMVDERGNSYDIYIHKDYRPRVPFMYHWWHCDIARNNSSVFNFALPYALQHRLLWVNFDAIMVTDEGDQHNHVSKHLSNNSPMGTWTSELLHEVEITAARSYKSRERNILPGVSQPLDIA